MRLARETQQRNAVADENRAAALIPDPRWVLAIRVSQTLQGGRAALLTPDRRRDLMTLATHLRLRPFDASLIIAIVQDAARRGEPLDGVARDRLTHVGGPTHDNPESRHAMLAILLGLLGAASLIAFV